MGGWRLQLFCCDADLDFIQDFNKECGLVALEAKHGKAPLPEGDEHRGALRQAEHNMMAQKGPSDGKAVHLYPKPTNDKANINFSVLAALCTHPEYVRRHLDTSGDFTAKMTSLRAKCLKARPGVLGGIQDPYGPGYMLCLLGACGMTLGVKISHDERNAMRKYYKDCGLMRDAVTQLGDALESDTGYVNGVSWDFGSPGRIDSMLAGGAPKEDHIFPGIMTNIWAPDHGRDKGEVAYMQKTVMDMIARGAHPSVDDMATTLACLFFDPYATPRTSISSTKADAHPELFRKEAEEFVASFAKAGSKAPKYGNKVCGNCGAETKADGSALLTCGKCKERRYCSADCQKKEWSDHKKACVAPAKVDPRATFIEIR